MFYFVLRAANYNLCIHFVFFFKGKMSRDFVGSLKGFWKKKQGGICEGEDEKLFNTREVDMREVKRFKL